MEVGGLQGQPNLAFLYPDWIESMHSNPLSFQFQGFTVGTPEKRLDWKRVRHHAPDAEWPPKGVKISMDYKMKDFSPEDFLTLSNESRVGRKTLFSDGFGEMSDAWKVRTSPLHERSSFMNEGKAGRDLYSK